MYSDYLFLTEIVWHKEKRLGSSVLKNRVEKMKELKHLKIGYSS